MSSDQTASAPLWRVALVVIARDEAPRLARLLQSVRPWVDDMVVLDTGSRDATVAIAQDSGARVGHFRWCDDFSAARNAALDLAAADWHVIADADEWLEAGGPALAQLRHTRPDFVGRLEIHNHQGDQEVSSWLSRILPGPVRYQGFIHEQPRHALPVRTWPVTLGHDGYQANALRAKDGRNARLLSAALARAPADAYLWYQLGKDHDVYQRYGPAVQAFDQAERLLGATAAPGWLHDLVVRRLHALKRCKRHAEAIQQAERQLPQWSHSPDYLFAIGDLLLDWAADAPDLAPQLLPMMEEAWQGCLRLGEHPELEGAVHGRGSHLAATNLALLYDVMARPDDATRYRALARDLAMPQDAPEAGRFSCSGPERRPLE
ncbi:glycosyltransferase [Ideonella sp. B7]|uniref:glycosyltransferase n=1 Tax=Ideonella benzenivorans TaxID=2831643 RepID=UPI001CEDF004|nr:glycosyltransferase [Ideonella benzenivorans]MCA6217992.1 glycosyltransferase [Ideonella benzenivorans]